MKRNQHTVDKKKLDASRNHSSNANSQPSSFRLGGSGLYSSFYKSLARKRKFPFDFILPNSGEPAFFISLSVFVAIAGVNCMKSNRQSNNTGFNIWFCEAKCLNIRFDQGTKSDFGLNSDFVPWAQCLRLAYPKGS